MPRGGSMPGVHDVVDDGKQTTMMAAVDLSALGLEVPGTTGQMAAVKPDDDNGDDEPEPPSRPSQPALPSSVKKRKKRR